MVHTAEQQQAECGAGTWRLSRLEAWNKQLRFGQSSKMAVSRVIAGFAFIESKVAVVQLSWAVGFRMPDGIETEMLDVHKIAYF